MANQLDFGELVARLMRDAETCFPLLAPIRIDRDHRLDAWRVMTRRGDFSVSEHAIPRGRRQLVEFFDYQLSQLQRRAEVEERQQQHRDREQLMRDALQPRIGAPIHLRVGDRITVNGRETRIVAINPDRITVEHLDARGLVEVECNCYDCRNARTRRQIADTDYDAMCYAQARWNGLPAPITPDAERRSIELLRRNLTPEQLEGWDRRHEIELHGGTTGARYRIRGEIGAFNIDREDGVRLCCSPGRPGDLPLGDYLLGQKLAIELDEDAFLRQANLANRNGALAPEGFRAIVTQADLDQLMREQYGGRY